MRLLPLPTYSCFYVDAFHRLMSNWKLVICSLWPWVIVILITIFSGKKMPMLWGHGCVMKKVCHAFQLTACVWVCRFMFSTINLPRVALAIDVKKRLLRFFYFQIKNAFLTFFKFSQRFLLIKLRNSYNYNNLQLKETGFFSILNRTMAEKIPT